MIPRPPVPVALREVRKSYSSRMSERHCDELIRYCGRDDYTWGFIIYRTVYSPGSDADSEKALEVLLAYMHSECFYDAVRTNDGEDNGDDISAEERAYYENLPPMSIEQWAQVTDNPFARGIENSSNAVNARRAIDLQTRNAEDSRGDLVDGRSNQQLWRRLRNEVVQDPFLEAATPAQLQLMFKQWVSTKGAEPSECSRYRFFIIMDSEIVRHLSRVSLPLPKHSSDWRMYSIKVFDAEFDPSPPSTTDIETLRLYDPRLAARVTKDEGWFWCPAWSLCYLFFEERASGRKEVCTWNEQDRPLYAGATL